MTQCLRHSYSNGICVTCGERRQYKTHTESCQTWRENVRRDALAKIGEFCVMCEHDVSENLLIVNVDGTPLRLSDGKKYQLYGWLRAGKVSRDDYTLVCRNCQRLWERQETRDLATLETRAIERYMSVSPDEAETLRLVNTDGSELSLSHVLLRTLIVRAMEERQKRRYGVTEKENTHGV